MTDMSMNWDPEVVEKFIKPESQQKEPEVFRETHVPISRIRAEILRPHDSSSEFVSEEDFRDAVLKSELKDDNRIFIVKGEVGSGKSHLCQWLEYEINGYGDVSERSDSHVAIHISRSNTKLDEILEILHEPVDKEYEEVGSIGDLDPEDVADFIIQGLLTFHKDRGQLKGFELEKFLEDFDSKTSFRDVLVDNLTDYQKAVEQEGKEQAIDLFTRDDYGEICFNVFGDTGYQTDTYPALRRAVHDLLTNNLGIENFKGQLEELSDAYVEAGKRPVLICEDLTTFNVLKDDLLDHIFDLSSSHFDIVLGWTSGWERENIDDALSTSDDSLSYMKQRSQGYLSMTDDQGRAYFLEDKSASLLLVEKYLEAIKKHSETSTSIPEDGFDNIYPFNEAFVHYVYQNLVQDGNRQQTPRVLLVHVIADCLTSTIPPFKKVETNAFVGSRPSVVSLEETESCQRLTKWYGKQDPDREKLWVPESVFNTFDIEFETGYAKDGIVYFDLDRILSGADLLTVPVDGETDPEDDPTTEGEDPDSSDDESDEDETDSGDSTEDRASDSGETTSNDDGDDDPTGPRIPTEKSTQFQDWIKRGSDYPSSNTLRDGVRMALNRWYEPTRLANENSTAQSTKGIYFARGSDVPVEIKGPDQPSERSYTIEHGVENYELYSKLLYAGVHEDFDEETNIDELRGWADDRVIKYRHGMRTEIETHLPEDMSVEEFVVLSKFLLMNTGQGASEVKRDILFEEYTKQSSSPLHRDSDIDIDLPMGMLDAFNVVTRNSSDIGGLVEGFFLLKKNVVDHERLDSAVKGVNENLDEYIEGMAYVSVDDLPQAYKIGTTRNNATTVVKDLITAVSDFTNELLKLKQNTSFDPIEEEIQTYAEVFKPTHNKQKLLEIYEKLDNSLTPLEVTREGRWKSIGDLLREEDTTLHLDDFGDALKEYQSIEADSPVEIMSVLHGYQQAKEQQKAWKVYDVLLEMIGELEGAGGAEKTDFEELVRESDEFASFSKKRDQVLELLGGTR
jgi:hypothetical protein